MRVEDQNVSRTSALLNLIAGAALLVVVNALSHGFGIPSDRLVGGVQVLTASDLGIHLPMGLINLWWMLVLLKHFLLFREGRWNRPLRWIELATGLLGAWILWVLFNEAALGFGEGMPIPALENRGLRILLGQAVAALLLVALLATLLASWKRLRRLLEPVASGAVAAPRQEGLARESRERSWGGFERALRRDLKEAYHFYLDDAERTRLSGMGTVGKSIHLVIWVLKSMYRKLTPARRALLVIALVAPTIGFQAGGTGVRLQGLGYIALLLIVLLELKDKLLAMDELAVGRAVQVALLPTRSPDVSGWDIWMYTEPANEVGGDLVDYLQIGEDRWGLALGDVAGKGLGAALLMAKVQSTFRALAPTFDTLSELASEMNAIIYRDGLRNRFASFVYLELRSRGSEVRVLNAGHPPPVILREIGIAELPRGGTALGLMPEATYSEERAEIRHGDIAVVYSDGVTDAMNAHGDMFGYPRLLETLNALRGSSSEVVGKRILSEVRRFVGDEPSSDDLSLIVLRRVS